MIIKYRNDTLIRLLINNKRMVVGDVVRYDAKCREKYDENIESIRQLLRIGIKPITDNDKLIPFCNPILTNIKCGKGGICIYCRTWFTVMLSLNLHMRKGC